MAEARSSHSPFRRPFAVLLATVFAVSFFKGVRLPSLWCATHFTFNYSQGFVRRGLVGEVARQLFGDGVFKYNRFLLFAFVAGLLLAVLLGRAIVRALRLEPRELGMKLALLAFAASPAFVFFVHTIGYFDYLGAIALLGFCFASLRIRKLFVPAYLALPLGGVLVLIHEGLAVMFLPALVFVMLCHAVREHRAKPLSKWTWAAWAVHVLLAVVPALVAAVLLSKHGTESGERVQQLLRYVQRSADFPIRTDAVETLTRSSAENMKRIVPWYWEQKSSRELAFKDFIAYLPGLLFLIYYGVSSIRRLELPRLLRWSVIAAFLAATFSPEFMNAVGWDWPRWNGITLLTCMCSILALKLFIPLEAPEPIRPWALTAGSVIAALGLASNTFLFDDYRVQYFPFERQFELLQKLIDSDFSYRPPKPPGC